MPTRNAHPTSAVNAGSGDPWSNPSNSLALDGSFATASPSGGDSKTLAVALALDSAIPTGATDIHVAVTIYRKASSASSPDIVDRSVTCAAGAILGANDLAAGGTWPTSVTAQSYGSTASDLWGFPTPPSGADVNVGLTVNLIVQIPDGDGVTAYVDYVEAVVSYTDPPGGPPGGGLLMSL